MQEAKRYFFQRLGDVPLIDFGHMSSWRLPDVGNPFKVPACRNMR